MKKLVLCLLVILCLCGCSFEKTQVSYTIKNKTDKKQVISIVNNATDNIVYDFEIEPFGFQSFTLDNWIRIILNTENSFNESFVCNFVKNNTWVIEYGEKTTYTIKSELDFDITVQNFNIVNGEKSSPCYSVFIPNNSSVNVATIDVYPEWLGNIWDLENRNIDSVNDYNDTLFQSVKHNGEDVYYEIIKTDRTINIRYRKG